jgi:hypothetical protein
MTEERRMANAALRAGPWENHDQIVIAVADGLGLEAQHVEAVLQRFRAASYHWARWTLPNLRLNPKRSAGTIPLAVA